LLTPDLSISFKDSIQWLVSRQTSDLVEDEDSDTSTEKKQVSYPVHPPLQGMEPLKTDVASLPESIRGLNISSDEIQYAGFNGRINKIADTCYAFWVGGSLAVRNLSRVWSIEETDSHPDVGQHRADRPRRASEVLAREGSAYYRGLRQNTRGAARYHDFLFPRIFRFR
jgi:hypothetical protein